jgi:hypothetical protein
MRFLLSRLQQLRQIFADLIRQAGHPRYDETGRSVGPMPTEILDVAYAQSARPDGAAQPALGDHSDPDHTGAWPE